MGVGILTLGLYLYFRCKRSCLFFLGWVFCGLRLDWNLGALDCALPSSWQGLFPRGLVLSHFPRVGACVLGGSLQRGLVQVMISYGLEQFVWSRVSSLELVPFFIDLIPLLWSFFLLFSSKTIIFLLYSIILLGPRLYARTSWIQGQQLGLW